MKIGEILIQRGLITKTQLKEALDAQLIFGGHLGTCLMELGYLNERRLGGVLAEIFDVDYAPPEVFESVPRFVIQSLNARLVEKHQAVPFRLQDKVLDVAMTDPKDLMGRDELSFASGYKVRCWVSPEARIFQAMERYYDIPRRLRYITLCKQIDRSTTVEAGPVVSRVEAMRDAVRAPQTTDAGGLYRATALPSATAVLEEDADTDPLVPLAHRLAKSEALDAVVGHVLEHASMTLHRAIVFLVRQGNAFPWQAHGVASHAERWATTSFGVTSEPVFELLNGDDLFHGPVPRQAPYRRFFEVLELEMPEEMLLVPAHVDDRLVAIFYGDGGPDGRIRGQGEFYRRLVRKMGLALGMVQLRQRVLSV